MPEMLPLTWKQNKREESFSLWKYIALEDTPALCSLVVSCVYYSRLLVADAKKANHTSFSKRENSFSYTTRHSKDRTSGKSNQGTYLLVFLSLICSFHQQILFDSNYFLFLASCFSSTSRFWNPDQQFSILSFSLHLSNLIEVFWLTLLRKCISSMGQSQGRMPMASARSRSSVYLQAEHWACQFYQDSMGWGRSSFSIDLNIRCFSLSFPKDC